MIKVDNRKSVSALAVRVYRGNGKRNLLTIFAIVMTTVLFTAIFGIGISYWKEVSERTVRMEGMKFDIQLSEPTEEQVEIIRDMDMVRYAGVAVKCAIVEKYGNQNLNKLQLYWVDETCWENQCLPAFASVTGQYPTGDYEVILSEQTLKTMGIANPEVGMELPVTYYNLNEAGGGEEIVRKIRLSGYYKDYSGNMRGYVSRAFYESTGAKQTDFTQGYVKISLKSPLFSDQDILELLQAVGIQDYQYLDADTNTVREFIKLAAGLAGLIVMILVSGYLFIYNTMYISVSKDIRFYGQLKTIGMTSRQLKGLIYRQALWNSLIGIPAGLALGALVSGYVVPEVLHIVNPAVNESAGTQANPVIYIGTVLFALFTVFISSRRPAAMAGNCSPVEAAKYAGPVSRRRTRRSRSGGSTIGMAWRNLFRDKKQAAVILVSYLIALTIFLTVNVVVRENDAARVLNQTYSYDFKILNGTTLDGDIPYLTDDKMEAVKGLAGVKEVRRVISTDAIVPYQEDILGEYYRDIYESRYAPGDYEEDMAYYKEHPEYSRFTTRFIGIEGTDFDRLNEDTGGILDKEAFLAGEFAVITPFMNNISAQGALGKEIEFYLPAGFSPDEKQSILVEAVCTTGADPAYFAGGYSPHILVSSGYAQAVLKEPYTELLQVTYEKPFDADLEQEIKNIFDGNDNIFYESKLDRYLEMVQNEGRIKVLGRGMAILLAVLAVLNYCNTIAAGQQNRKNEFAALNSIGMTVSQLRRMLMLEGLGYALISIGLSALIGTPFSVLVFRSMNIYRIAFSYPAIENAILFLAILAICVLVPPASFRITQKGSVIERLREISG